MGYGLGYAQVAMQVLRSQHIMLCVVGGSRRLLKIICT